MKYLATISLFIICNSCACGQSNKQGFLDKAQPGETGLNPYLMDKLVADIRSEKLQNIDGMVIIKDDKLILESYFDEYEREDLHYTASVSKSIASLLLGIAIDQGFLDGTVASVLNRNISELFPEYEDLIAKDSLKKDLKLKHILSMTAGFRWDEHSHPYTDPRNDCHRINSSPDPMKFLFERELVSPPGSQFYYNGGLSLSMSWLIERHTGMKVDQFAEKYLFGPLAITKYQWEEVAGGIIDTDGGLHLTPMDQAKLGYLCLNGGRMNDTQVVSEEWIRASTQVHFHNVDMPDYGYQWWGGDFHCMNQAIPSFLASGHGGQAILVMPDFELVMVLNQQVFSNPYGQLNLLSILSDYLIPAITGDNPEPEVIPMTQEKLASFAGHFESEDGDEFIDVQAGHGKLVLMTSNGQQDDFYPVSDQAFVGRILDIFSVQVEFVPDGDSHSLILLSNFGYTSKRLTRF